MPKEIIKDSAQWIFNEAFCRVYPADGHDPVNEANKINHNEYDDYPHYNDVVKHPVRVDRSSYDEANKWFYLYHPLTMLSSFVGLPNKSRGEEQSWKNLGLNFIGWTKGDSPRTRLLFKIISPLTALKNALLILPILFWNILRLFTEFLPTLGIIALQSWHRILFYQINTFPSRAWIYQSLRLFNILLRIIPHILVLAGRAMTSPGMAVRMAWYDGKALGVWLGLSADNVICVQALFAMTSIFITIVTYTLLLPLTIKLIAVSVLPNLPAALVTAMGILAKGFAAVGQAGLLVCAKVTGLSFAVATMPELAGIGFIMGAVVSIAGVMADKIYRRFHPENEDYYEFEESDSVSSYQQLGIEPERQSTFPSAVPLPVQSDNDPEQDNQQSHTNDNGENALSMF